LRRRWLWLGVLLVWTAPQSAARAEGIGVAPFEVVPSGRPAPDLGALLANRLATRGVGRVAGPGELGAPARFDPAAGEAQGWARAAGVDAIVVGRTTRIGSGLSVHAKLIDGVSGKPVGAPVIEEAARPEDLGRAIDGLTASLIDRLAKRPGAVSAAAPAEKPAPKERAGMRFERGKPLSIQSDELEAAPDAKGRRHLVFVGHVRARQGDLSLDADRLEAFYPPGASEPDRLSARGHVTIKQGDRVARCAEAIFHRQDERIVCTGQLAEIEQSCDLLRSPKITFHVGSERLEAAGPVDVKIRPNLPGCGIAAAREGSAR
jgi:lipopolysaccharide export system protein LptA